jgi:hypothetical protein
VVVEDQPARDIQDLEGMSYVLCYAHEIVTSPVSIPAFVYGAHDLAKRGKNNHRVIR